MSTQLIATVNSDGSVSPGQKHRSSDNFKFDIPDAAIDLQWQVTNSPNINTVKFNVMQDVTWGPDPVINGQLHNGSLTGAQNEFQSDTNYYIANPSDNPGNPPPPFTVQVYAVFPNT